jgi:hypothetical protein
MTEFDSHALQPALQRAQQTLKSALEEACRADVDHLNTGELIRVEETLAIANEAAKEAVTVRRRLAMKRGAMGESESPGAASPDNVII